MMSKAKFMKKMAAVVMAGAMMTVMAVPVMAATSPIGEGVDGLRFQRHSKNMQTLIYRIQLLVSRLLLVQRIWIIKWSPVRQVV